MAGIQLSLLAVFSICLLFTSGAFSATFTITNQCSYPVWPGLLSGAGRPQLPTTGFTLDSGASATIPVPASWSGRVWGRTLCSTDPTTSKFTCVTADCGSGTIECNGAGAIPPATLAEFTLNGANGLDFYDVSLVDGFNLPMLVIPLGGTGGGNCTATGCIVDLNNACPVAMKVLSTSNGNECVACKSACATFGEPMYCCTGAYGTPGTCQPTSYSLFFKNACPRAYSYAYDDGSSTFTCASADYVITFCPTPAASQKSSPAVQSEIPEATNISGSSKFPEATKISSSSSSRCTTAPFLFITTFIVTLLVIWRSSI